MGNLKTKSVVVACLVTVAALALSSAALAATSAVTAYGGKGANTGSEARSAQAAAKAVHSNSPTDGTAGLPFTALDVTLMLGGGIVLIASGVALGGFVLRRARV